jgi:hypothetical protein
LSAAAKLLELAAKYHDTTKPTTPPHEGHIIEYVHRIITTPGEEAIRETLTNSGSPCPDNQATNGTT